MNKTAKKRLDPLFVIFEKHLYDFSYEDAELFISGVVEEYMEYLYGEGKMSIQPRHVEEVTDDLSREVHDMLLKKIYGCFSIKDYQESGKIAELDRNKAKQNYIRLIKSE